MDDWERMQREAERRVRNSRARNAERVHNSELRVPDFLRTTEKEISSVKSTHTRKNGGILDFLNLGNIDIDSDRSMILMMLALLSGEENDELLMLALLYIML